LVVTRPPSAGSLNVADSGGSTVFAAILAPDRAEDRLGAELTTVGDLAGGQHAVVLACAGHDDQAAEIAMRAIESRGANCH
jgi:streptomycin 6-kinase